MIRTQIYLPEEIHSALLRLAKLKGITLSRLICQGVDIIVKKNYCKSTPQKKTLNFFANPPKKYRIKLTGKQAVELMSEERAD